MVLSTFFVFFGEFAVGSHGGYNCICLMTSEVDNLFPSYWPNGEALCEILRFNAHFSHWVILPFSY